VKNLAPLIAVVVAGSICSSNPPPIDEAFDAVCWRVVETGLSFQSHMFTKSDENRDSDCSVYVGSVDTQACREKFIRWLPRAKETAPIWDTNYAHNEFVCGEYVGHPPPAFTHAQ